MQCGVRDLINFIQWRQVTVPHHLVLLRRGCQVGQPYPLLRLSLGMLEYLLPILL